MRVSLQILLSSITINYSLLISNHLPDSTDWIWASILSLRCLLETSGGRLAFTSASSFFSSASPEPTVEER